jgi:hypothetical protein
MRGQFGLTQALEPPDDAADHPLDPLGIHRTLAGRQGDRADQFFAIERRPAPGPLEDGQFAQLHPLEGREATAALRTEPPASNGRSILGGATVLHLAFGFAAEGTAQDLVS